MPDVAVALSGGVDSSVAAALLVEEGHDVFGVTMRLGLAEIAGRPCCGEEEVALARRVCATLGIPHVVIDIAEAFEAEVVEPFCEAYARGETPNPCVRCNERIKLGAFVERVKRLGATTLATGHYARLLREGDHTWLLRAVDDSKDQSYFLYRVKPEVLAMLEFPLGDLTKAEVRRMAEERGLPTAGRRESMEVCFTSDHVALVETRHPRALEPGPIENREGAVLGTHRGIARYTIGQRKGLGVGGPQGPLQVVAIDAPRNTIVVAQSSPGRDDTITLTDHVWRLGKGTTRVLAHVRYRSAPRPAVANLVSDGLEVIFDAPIEPLAPGQSVVLYAGHRVVGGGIVPPPASCA